MSDALRVEYSVRFERGPKGRGSVVPGTTKAEPVATGMVPRISRLMALAIRFDDLVRRGEVTDCAEIARLGHVTRARVSQIFGLLNLAPDIQEQILNLPLVAGERDAVPERLVRPITIRLGWAEQRRMWQSVCRRYAQPIV